jgi:predicted nucleotidyltransferase
MRHRPSSIDIDLTPGGLPFEQEAVERSIAHDLGGLAVRLPRVEDLLVMKSVAGRPKDLQDMEALLVTNPAVDVDFVRRWVGESAAAMSMPDMLDQLDRLLARRC